MKKRVMLKVIPLILVLSLLSVGSVGCGTEWEGLLLELLGEWADTHDVNPATPGGAVNLAKRAASGSTGDERADAAIGLVETVKDIRKGDKLMEEGRREKNPTKMLAAIGKRPNDWSYRISYGVQMLRLEGITSDAPRTASTHFNKAHDIVTGSKSERVRCYTQTIEELETSEFDVHRMAQNTKVVYFGQLKYAYQNRGFLTENEADRATGLHYQDLLEEIGREAEAKKK